MPTRKKLNDKELLELGKKLEQFYETGYINKKQALTFAVYKGIASGFGVVIGGTIVVGLLIWILGFFDQIPGFDSFIEKINHSLQNK